jgi:hypothetical protein
LAGDPRALGYHRTELRTSLSDDLWQNMIDVGVLCGAVMLLRETARALQEVPSPRAEAEWQWWIDALVRQC